MCKWKVTLSDSDIDDIMADAMEGGITAEWCKYVLVGDGEDYLGEYTSDQISRGGVLQFVADDGVYKLDKTKFLVGLRKAIDEEYVEMRDGEIDMDAMDAISSDAIVQMALFGEVIYG